MPPKRKASAMAAAGLSRPLTKNGTASMNGLRDQNGESDTEMTPPPPIKITLPTVPTSTIAKDPHHPTHEEVEAAVDRAVEKVLNKRRRTAASKAEGSYKEHEASEDEEAEQVEAVATPKKSRTGGAKTKTTPARPARGKSKAQVKKENEEEEEYIERHVTEEPSEYEHEEEEEVEPRPVSTPTPKKGGRARKAAAVKPNGVANGTQHDADALGEPVTPAKRPRAAKTASSAKSKATAERDSSSSPLTEAEAEEGEGDVDEEEGATPKRGKGKGNAKKKTPKKPTPKKSRLAKDEPEYDSDGNEIVKKKRKPKVYPKIEYDIPDVERLETTFKGRLGYACLNTVLRNTKPDSIFCSRTCRIASIKEEGMELPKGLALMNCRDLLTMIEWNEQNKIRFLRLSSEMFPFASHAEYGYSLDFADAELKAAGALARKYRHRITMHPGQFTQIGSPKPAVVKASVRELEYQCEILDRMGIEKDGVMIIHMGGIYGDKETTLARFKENYTTKLSESIKARLVLENDEICYNVDDLLPICNELEIPIIFDYHHDWINPSSRPPSELIPLIKETWDKKGIRMKQHLSEPRPGAETIMEKRAHADRCKRLPPDLPDDVDLMIEAKDKEQAVFELYRIYGLEDVIHDNLRPPDPEPSLQTKGRKSSVKKKTKDTGEVDEDGNPIKLEDFEKEGDGQVGDEGIKENRMEEVDEDAKAELQEYEHAHPNGNGNGAASSDVGEAVRGEKVMEEGGVNAAVNGTPEKPGKEKAKGAGRKSKQEGPKASGRGGKGKGKDVAEVGVDGLVKVEAV